MVERIAFRVQSHKFSYWQTVGLVFELPNDMFVLIVLQFFSDRIGEVKICLVFSGPLVYTIVLDIVYQ